MWKSLEKRLFFRADIARLGKYCTGGYGRIGVYRVKQTVIGKHYRGLNKEVVVVMRYCTYKQVILILGKTANVLPS